jgi:hypothetical protein
MKHYLHKIPFNTYFTIKDAVGYTTSNLNYLFNLWFRLKMPRYAIGAHK